MTAIKIVLVDEDVSLIGKWNTYVDEHPYSTIYHQFVWRTIFKQGLGYSSIMLMACDMESEGQVCGILPLYLVQGFFANKLVSVPFRDRGGVLWTNDAAFDALVAQAKQISQMHKINNLVLKSLNEWPLDFVTRSGMTKNMHWINSQVSLVGMTHERVWKKIGTKTRNMIRQAEENGLCFEDWTDSPSAIDDWFLLHLITQKRLGVPPFPRKFFETMLFELKKINAIKMYCVTSDSKPISAMLMLEQGEVSIYGYSASTVDAQKMRANDLMIYSAIKQLITNQFQYFDMGSDSPKQDTLLFFKRKWGAVQNVIPFYALGKGQKNEMDSSSGHYMLARRIFSNLPLAASSMLGRHLTRYFG